VLRELLHRRVRPGPDPDRVHHSGEHERHVARRLPARHLQFVLSQDERMPAELVDARLERDAGARRGLVEDERDALALERARGQAIGLQLDRPVEELPLLRGRKLLAG
jgi:hypothetical protein